MLTSQINCLGLSHHHTPVETLERVLFTVEDLKTLLMRDRTPTNGAEGGRFSAINELVLLSTCNRIELYGCIDATAAEARSLLFDLLVEACRESRRQANWESTEEAECLAREHVEDTLYHFSGRAALRHLCGVACGIDSMVLGETQILKQISTAHERAVVAGTTGPVLSKVFHVAQRSGRHARTNTAISKNPASISSVAVSLVQKLLGDLGERDVLVVGLGEMGQQAIKVLVGRGARHLRLANRTLEKAAGVAAHIQRHADVTCLAHPLGSLHEPLADVDAVITATGSQEPLIGAETVRRVMGERGERELVIVDISLPRNVDTDVGNIDHVRLFDNDGLKSNLDDAVARRRDEIPKVETLIEKEIRSLEIELRKLRVKPLITDLRRKAEAIRQKELERTYKMLGEPDPATWSHVQHFSRALVNKLFHEPTTRIEEAAANGDAETYASTIRQLFDLKEASDG